MKLNIFTICVAAVFTISACDIATPPVDTVPDKVQPTTPITPTPSTANAASMACLTEAMYFEARGTGERGMRAVGEVVINRKNSSKFPNSICGVVNQYYNGTCQFSYVCDGIPETYREPAQKALAQRIAKTLLTDRGKDITNGALFFHAARIRAGWFATLSPRGLFGGNKFYR